MAAKSLSKAKLGGGTRFLREPPQSHTPAPSVAELASYEPLLQALLDRLSALLFRKDKLGRFSSANPRFCAWVGKGIDEIPGATEHDLFPRELADRILDDERRWLASGCDQTVCEYEWAGAAPAWVQLVRTAIRDPGGTIEGFHGVLIPMSGPANGVLEDPAFYLQTLLENSADDIHFKDSEGRYTRVSRHMARKLGLSDPGEACGKTDRDYAPQDQAAKSDRDERSILTTGVPLYDIEEKRVLPNGGVEWISTTKMPMRDRAGKIIGTFGISRDITDRKRVEAQLARQSLYDAVTNLPNRALFMNRMEHLFRRAARHSDESFLFALVYLDIDRFKGINDSLGHQAGDELVKQVGRRLEKCVRPSDTLARFGGDDFAILLEDLRSPADATRVAERIHAQLEAPFMVRGTEVFLTASLGIALSKSEYERTEDMLRDADTAMYRAKANGRSRHEIFDVDMHHRAVSQLQIETDLRRAIERAEFLVHYQPIVDLESRALVGFEALVRWQHPQKGLLAPAAFLSVAEETGLIAPISFWVLEDSCRQLRAWQDSHPGRPPLKMSVNLSSHQLSQPDLVERVQRALDRAGVSPHQLTLEITESALMRDIKAAAAVIGRLRALGIELNIDDFGTGYSSLSYLQGLPLDALKIDRSFVHAMGPSSKPSEIVHAIVTLAYSLGMKVVAEGVETPDQLMAIKALRCHQAQGFLIAPPLPAADAEALIADGVRF